MKARDAVLHCVRNRDRVSLDKRARRHVHKLRLFLYQRQRSAVLIRGGAELINNKGPKHSLQPINTTTLSRNITSHSSANWRQGRNALPSPSLRTSRSKRTRTLPLTPGLEDHWHRGGEPLFCRGEHRDTTTPAPASCTPTRKDHTVTRNAGSTGKSDNSTETRTSPRENIRTRSTTTTGTTLSLLSKANATTRSLSPARPDQQQQLNSNHTKTTKAEGKTKNMHPTQRRCHSSAPDDKYTITTVYTTPKQRATAETSFCARTPPPGCSWAESPRPARLLRA